MPDIMRIRCHPTLDRIDLTILDEHGADSASVSFNAKDAGRYAALLLRSAQIVLDGSGKPAIVSDGIEMPVVVYPNLIRSAQIPRNDATALIFHFGEASIGIAVSKQHAVEFEMQHPAAHISDAESPNGE
jgi:hypothetical protein